MARYDPTDVLRCATDVTTMARCEGENTVGLHGGNFPRCTWRSALVEVRCVLRRVGFGAVSEVQGGVDGKQSPASGACEGNEKGGDEGKGIQGGDKGSYGLIQLWPNIVMA